MLATFVVNSTNDVVDSAGCSSSHCSLREAITSANNTTEKDVIRFAVSGTGNHVIQPRTALPTITSPLDIDGSSQPGYGGKPLIDLDGSLAGSAHGIEITGGNSTVRGLVIRNFQRAGIVLTDGSNNLIVGNFIGTDATGTIDKGNGGDGIFIARSANNVIGGSSPNARNVISGNTAYGVVIDDAGARNNVIAGNYIGTTVDGMTALGNDNSGILVRNGAQGNVIGTNGDGVADVQERNIISSNSHDGIVIGDANTSGNVVAGNFIGTDASGTKSLGTQHYGVKIINGASSNRIGTNGNGVADLNERNVISGNLWDGIYIGDVGTDNNVVAGNFIGVSSDGMSALGNENAGILVRQGAKGNLIGTNGDGVADVQERNVISANIYDGIVIQNAGTNGNVVAGNYIGTDASGTKSLDGQHYGVLIHDAASSNRVGTDGNGVADVNERNVISGNLWDGINIRDIGTANNVVAGNYIGVSSNGQSAIGNSHGVLINYGAKSNRIGTNADGTSDLVERNVISGNIHSGVVISDAGSSQNIVSGNFIGTDATGVKALANEGQGVHLKGGANNNTIGGSQQINGNLISGNAHEGVFISGSGSNNNVILNNTIGLGFSGGRLGNQGSGVFLEVGPQNNTIGRPGQGNTISGNHYNGITIYGRGTNGTSIQGNRIGTGSDGLSSIGNTGYGIRIEGGSLQGNPPTVIYTIDVSGSVSSSFPGTPVGDINGDGASNTILDAELAGLIDFTKQLETLGLGDVVQVGITVFGSSGVPLDVDIFTQGNQWTTDLASDRNNDGTLDLVALLRTIRSGHQGAGAGTDFSDALQASINTFNAEGVGPGDGNLIFLSDGENNSSSSTFASQVTALNALKVKNIAIGVGVGSDLSTLQSIDSGASIVNSSDELSTVLLKVLGLPKSQPGQSTTNISMSTLIGGTVSGAGNVIAFNGADGIGVLDPLATGISISKNSIHSNTKLGIDLGGDAVTANDRDDVDGGANNLQNYPAIDTATRSGSSVNVVGTFSSRPGQTYTIEVFGNRLADPSGYGEGEVYLTSFPITTNSLGLASINRTISSLPANINAISMTATDSSGNTSEFSNAKAIGSTALPEVSVSATVASVNEDGSQNLVFRFSRSGATTNALTVNFNVGGTASLSDYITSGAASFGATSGSVVISAGQNSANVTLDPTADQTIEPNETVIVTLANNTGYTISTTEKSATGTIVNDDSVAAAADVEVTGNSNVIADGDSSPATADGTLFGSAELGAAAIVRSFVVRNRGTAVLTLSGLTVPAGFSIVNPLSSSLSPGASDTFSVQLDTASSGTKSGDIRFTSNDPDTSTFNFAVSGTVTQPSTTTKYQKIVADNQTIQPGGTLELPLEYSVVNGSASLTGMSLNVHFDSSKLTFVGTSDLIQRGLQGNPVVYDDANGTETDKFIRFDWVDQSANWPGVALPAILGKIQFQAAAGLKVGDTTRVLFSASNSPNGYGFLSTPTNVAVASGSLDVNGDGDATALEDGILIVRYLLNRPASDFENPLLLPTGSTRTTAAAIGAYMDDAKAAGVFDANGDGKNTALEDGILIVRYLLSQPNSSLENSLLITPTSTRKTGASVRAHLDGFLPPGKSITPLGGEWDPALSTLIATAAAAGEASLQQIVSGTLSSSDVLVGDAISIDTMYTTSPETSALTGMSLRLHYDSSRLEFSKLTDVLSRGIQGDPYDLPDTDDWDSDPATDRYILADWVDFGVNWPGESLPASLMQTHFNVLAPGETNINYTASRTTNGYTFASTSVSINAVEELGGLDLVQSDGSTFVSETGLTDSFSVSLLSRPDSDVYLTIDTSGINGVSADIPSLHFTPNDWNVAQSVHIVADSAFDASAVPLAPIRIAIDSRTTASQYAQLPEQTIDLVPVAAQQPLEIIVDSGGYRMVDVGTSTDVLSSQWDPSNLVLTTGSGDEVFQISGAAIAGATLHTAGGDDQITISSLASLQIDGGDGFDTVRLPGVQGVLDVSGSTMFRRIERLDARSSASAEVKISALAVAEMTDDNDELMLVLSRDQAYDVGSGWNDCQPTVIDGRAVHRVTSDQGTLLLDNDRPWHNLLFAEDVNHNGRVEPLDALLILNRISEQPGQSLPSSDSGVAISGYDDVNGDGSRTPLDALLVLNYLISNASQSRAVAQGEAAAPPVRTRATLDEHRQFFAAYAEPDLLTEPLSRMLDQALRVDSSAATSWHASPGELESKQEADDSPDAVFADIDRALETWW